MMIHIVMQIERQTYAQAVDTVDPVSDSQIAYVRKVAQPPLRCGRPHAMHGSYIKV